MLGDARVVVDETGNCTWRALPDILDPMPQLGRALFFSLDLSGDRDVACATCHHPALGGGDAISLSMGPGPAPHLMGADRVRGLADPSALHVARNAPTTFNIGLWDAAVFWDGRVEAQQPVLGTNGAGGDIVVEDLFGESLDDATPSNLTEAQSFLPVASVHEMAGSWGAAFDTPAERRQAIAARLAEDASWVAPFEALCETPPLPESWQAACDADDMEALFDFAHIAHALGEYQRSQVFTDHAWSAYVQGDVDAISELAKRGALVFYRNVGEGGQGCARCHSGDLFSDEQFHAIAGHQIGPGTWGDGRDLGRAGVTDESADDWRFRTPSLLNVEATAPYFHAGSMASLTQTVVFYRNIAFGVEEYFGEPGRQELHPRPWCRMTQFASMPDCDELYTSDHTHGGDVIAALDEDASDIIDFEGTTSSSMVAFLRSLTDPRVRDSAALSPWIDPDAVHEVTETSSEWATYCEVMAERDSVLNLRAKGFRWVATGAIADEMDVNTDALLHDLFGFAYWEEIDPDFPSQTGLERTPEILGAITLEALSTTQRAALLEGYAQLMADGHYQTLLEARQGVFDELGRLRAGDATTNDDWMSWHAQAVEAEAQVVAAMAGSYRATLMALPEGERAAHRTTLVALSEGDLSSLPEGVFDPAVPSITLSDDGRAALSAVDTVGGPELLRFVAQYTTFWSGWDCRYSFMPRLDEGARRGNYFGFLPWSNRYVFNLDNGTTGMGPLMSEIAVVMGQEEVLLGLESMRRSADLQSIRAQRAQNAARDALAEALVALQEPALSGAAAATQLERVEAAYAEVGGHERDQLSAEVSYFVAFAQALAAAGNTRLVEYLSCIEHPDTQAMRGRGGFDARGGGSCIP
ncbi:MAG TPA: hypothetical protein DFR83_16190 [Deltaproteobacteria bacterium]|nr:hypothetical protein [Deltaproteobacteria bacterium]